MTIADQIYAKVKELPEADQAEILTLVDSRSRRLPLKRISTMGLIKHHGRTATWKDFQEARREAWKSLGELPPG